MCPGILTEHGFKHKGNHYATLPWSGTKKDQNKYSGFRRDVKRRVLASHFRATSGQNVLYMRSDVSKEMSRFRLPSSGRRRLLVPNDAKIVRSRNAQCKTRESR